MARDQSQQERQEQSPSEEASQEYAGPITIATSDPAIETAIDGPSDWKAHPDSTVCLETSQAQEPSPLFVVGVRRNQDLDSGVAAEKGRTQARERDHPGRDRDDHRQTRDDRGNRPQARPHLSMTKNLLVTAGIALVGGVIGAVGYSAIFASKSDKPLSDQSQSEGKSSSKDGSSKKAT